LRWLDLVDQEHGIERLGVAQSADDRSGHGADVCTAVTSDLRLVTDAADGDANELSPERSRDRLAE
jgi:hypothetical protein